MSGEHKFLIGAGVLTIALVVLGALFLGDGGKKTGEVASAVVNPLDSARHTMGEATASATIVEFGDYQCPACAQADPIIKSFLEAKGDSVYFAYRHFPLPSHRNANDAARAAEAAGNQGKYWEMHTMLFEKQGEWSDVADAREKFSQFAQDLGLDVNRFKKDMDEAIAVINEDARLGSDLGVQSTPTFFVNGKMYPGVLSYDKLLELTK